MPIEVLCTAVSERADLFIETMETMISVGEVRPSRLIVHEDVRPGSDAGPIGAWLKHRGIPYEHKATAPSRGLGPAMLWCFKQARSPIVFYTQEDWRFVRSVPVAKCLEIMEAHSLNHVRFNKRKTMSAKAADTPNPWHKVEVSFADAQGVDQKFCISDHWYTQASLWRVGAALPGLEACAEKAPQANAFVATFNDHMNRRFVGGDYKRTCMDQMTRHKHLKTYIWGPVAEPKFIEHMGSIRTTGPIQHVGEIREMKRRK